MPDIALFRPEFAQFLRPLKRHNNRDSFAKNKQRYEEVVRDPALLFIGSLGPHLDKLSPISLPTRARHAARSSSSGQCCSVAGKVSKVRVKLEVVSEAP